MFRQSFLIGSALVGVATVAVADTASAQGQSRDDLLDALTRHIQICSELADTQQRLACYDRLQTQVGSAAPTPTHPTPTPLQPSPQPSPAYPPPSQSAGGFGQPTPLAPPPTSNPPISSTPLPQQPLTVPGGGVAALGGAPPPVGGGSSSSQDPDAAFDPRQQVSRPSEGIGPRPQSVVRRTGPRPIPYSSTPQPLVTLGANNLTYGDSRYWQVTVTLTSNTPRPIMTQAQCTFLNGGRVVSSDNLGPVTIQPGEQVTTELIGPPTTTYVDSTNCRVVNP
jgi:hypothetical protein